MPLYGAAAGAVLQHDTRSAQKKWAIGSGGYALAILEALATFALRELGRGQLGRLLLGLELVSSLLLEGLLLGSSFVCVLLHDGSLLRFLGVHCVGLSSYSSFSISLLATFGIEGLLLEGLLLRVGNSSIVLVLSDLCSLGSESTLLLLVERLVLLLVGCDCSCCSRSRLAVLLGGLVLLLRIVGLHFVKNLLVVSVVLGKLGLVLSVLSIDCLVVSCE